MPRGPHASDAGLFAADQIASLRSAAFDLAWLLGRGYAETSALKLVGDRYALRQRQREALRRGVCTEAAAVRRGASQCALSDVHGRIVAVDAFNCLITLESALAGGVLLRGLDGALRDLASVHGSYRRTEVTHCALDLLCDALATAGPQQVRWFVDRPVSNSGRLRAWILERAPSGLGWQVELPNDADAAILAEPGAIIASADAQLLDKGAAWVDLPGAVLGRTEAIPGRSWIIDLRMPEPA